MNNVLNEVNSPNHFQEMIIPFWFANGLLTFKLYGAAGISPFSFHFVDRSHFPSLHSLSTESGMNISILHWIVETKR